VSPRTLSDQVSFWCRRKHGHDRIPSVDIKPPKSEEGEDVHSQNPERPRAGKKVFIPRHPALAGPNACANSTTPIPAGSFNAWPHDASPGTELRQMYVQPHENQPSIPTAPSSGGHYQPNQQPYGNSLATSPVSQRSGPARYGFLNPGDSPGFLFPSDSLEYPMGSIEPWLLTNQVEGSEPG
jgi:hypothetical protein